MNLFDWLVKNGFTKKNGASCDCIEKDYFELDRPNDRMTIYRHSKGSGVIREKSNPPEFYYYKEGELVFRIVGDIKIEQVEGRLEEHGFIRSKGGD